MHAPRPALARRDVRAVPRLHADRPRRRLRDDPDLGERATSSTSTPRRLCGGSDTQVHVQGQVPVDAALRRRHPGRQAGRLPTDRPRPGRRLRDRQRAQGRDLARSARATARTCSTCSSTATSRTEDPHGPSRSSRPPPDAADVQLVLHRRQAHRGVHAAACCPSRRPSVDPGLLTKGTRQVRVARLPLAQGATRTASTRARAHRQLEQHGGARLRRRRRRVEPQRLGRSGSTCSTRTSSGWPTTASGTLASVTSAMNAAATQDVRAIDTRAAAAASC